MNRYTSGLLTALSALTLLGATTIEAQAGRLAYIDSQRILAEAPGTSDAQRAFEQDMERYRAELAGLETELETMQDNFERQQAMLSATVRQERQVELQQKFMAYQQRQTELEETAQQRQAELVGPIMERIMTVIEDIRREGSYAVIFDAAAGGFAAADPELDLTDQVVQRLQQSASR